MQWFEGNVLILSLKHLLTIADIRSLIASLRDKLLRSRVKRLEEKERLPQLTVIWLSWVTPVLLPSRNGSGWQLIQWFRCSPST